MMNAYYRRLANGQPRVEALHAVQRLMLQGQLTREKAAAEGLLRNFEDGDADSAAPTDWSHPYYWASFTMSGADGVVRW